MTWLISRFTVHYAHVRCKLTWFFSAQAVIMTHNRTNLYWLHEVMAQVNIFSLRPAVRNTPYLSVRLLKLIEQWHKLLTVCFIVYPAFHVRRWQSKLFYGRVRGINWATRHRSSQPTSGFLARHRPGFRRQSVDSNPFSFPPVRPQSCCSLLCWCVWLWPPSGPRRPTSQWQRPTSSSTVRFRMWQCVDSLDETSRDLYHVPSVQVAGMVNNVCSFVLLILIADITRLQYLIL